MRSGNQFNPGTIKRLFSYMTAYKVRFVFVIIFSLISATVSASTSLFLQILIDQYVIPLLGQVNPALSGLFQLTVFTVVIYSAGVLSTWLYNRIMVDVEQGALKKIRDDLFANMQTLPTRYFDTRAHGDVMSLYTNDIDTLRMAISQGFPQILTAIFSTGTVFAAMLYLSVSLSAFVVVFSLILMIVVKTIIGRSAVYYVKQQTSLGDINGYIEEMINGQKVIKVFCREEKTEVVFKQKNETLWHSATEAIRYGNITMPVISSMGYILYVLLGLVGGAAGMLGMLNLRFTGIEALTIGTIISFITLSRNFVNPIGHISVQINLMIQALAGASRIFDLMDEPGEMDDGCVTLVNANIENGVAIECKNRSGMWAWKHPHSDGTVTYTQLRGEIRFLDVDFGYNKDAVVLHNINIHAKPGQKVALVGTTGAGKTTVANLLSRFYDLTYGSICYDGININIIRKTDLRRSLGMVLQDVHLFTGTVMDNIRYGRLDATDEECIQSARLAHADDFIRMLPQGYDTMLDGSGNNLSQGQLQLISIARAIVADPPVLILDEATSSIDTRTESIVQKGMDTLMNGRTVFVIAHRISTIQNADVVMVLEQGRIIERGSHQQLMHKKGKYYQLYCGTFELS
jgi:ABC-type multidrug transport system, ATPase and permease components